MLLSIGYSSCHWCHVMAHESFENPEIAALMNELFVCIKVDREERPDIDALYMQATLGLTGSGGWPMTVFLTPDAKPFFAGTYFPPEPRQGMPGFPELLRHVANAYRRPPRRRGVHRRADRRPAGRRRPPRPRPRPRARERGRRGHRSRDRVRSRAGGLRHRPEVPAAPRARVPRASRSGSGRATSTRGGWSR